MAVKLNTNAGTLAIHGMPDHCPYCHRSVTPNALYGHLNSHVLEVFMWCPDARCKRAFIAYYDAYSGTEYHFHGAVSQGELKAVKFSETVEAISPAFSLLYGQAFVAEQQGLTEICGVGYRKALEFLVKDYTIRKYSDKQSEIEKKFLGNVINDYVTDTRIKAVATRATWLGNDEAHYTRKWEGKDLSDLKKLIDLTVHWIEMEELTESFINEMPEAKPVAKL